MYTNKKKCIFANSNLGGGIKTKNAFTLIELLAIIVILAIIAVITVPIILNVIDNASSGAAVDSAHGFSDAVSKSYLSNLVTDSSNELPTGTYLMMEDGTLTDKDSNVLDVNVSGSVPEEDSWIKVVKGQVVAYSLKFGDYVVTKSENTEAEAIKNGTIAYNPDTPIPSFADASWTEIKTILSNNRNAYAVGSTKEVVIDDISYTVRLANTSSCPNDWPQQASQSACGVVIEFVDTIIDTDNNNTDGHVMNSTNTNAGGWPASEMYSYLNTTIFNKLPDELKTDGMILTTQTLSGHEKDVSTNYTSTNDKLYLLSYVELLGTNNDYDSVKLVDGTVLDGTRQLEYYGMSGSTRIKTTTGGSATYWWLRSAYSNGDLNFLIVNSYDSIQPYNVSSAIGVAPAFRILD